VHHPKYLGLAARRTAACGIRGSELGRMVAWSKAAQFHDVDGAGALRMQVALDRNIQHPTSNAQHPMKGERTTDRGRNHSPASQSRLCYHDSQANRWNLCRSS
jgi:hypothetical protein